MAWRLAARSFLAASISVLAFQAPALAQSGLGTDPRVTTGTLENGLTYVLMPLEDPAPPAEGADPAEAPGPRGAAIRLIIDAGILHETDVVARPLKARNASREIALIWRKNSPRAEEFKLLAKELRAG